jgi:hypothetical protein
MPRHVLSGDRHARTQRKGHRAGSDVRASPRGEISVRHNTSRGTTPCKGPGAPGRGCPRKTAEQPHAKAGHAVEPALRRAHALRRGVSFAGDAERPLPHAWRALARCAERQPARLQARALQRGGDRPPPAYRHVVAKHARAHGRARRPSLRGIGETRGSTPCKGRDRSASGVGGKLRGTTPCKGSNRGQGTRSDQSPVFPKRARRPQVHAKPGECAAELSQLGNIVVEKHHLAPIEPPITALYRVSSGIDDERRRSRVR